MCVLQNGNEKLHKHRKQAAFTNSQTEHRNAAIFMPSCHGVEANKALYHGDLWGRF